MPGRNRTVKTNCGVCLQEIVEGKDEATKVNVSSGTTEAVPVSHQNYLQR